MLLVIFLFGLLKSIIIVGKTIKVTKSDINTPTLIINPRLITGSIFDAIRDENPAIVVSMTYKQGLNIDDTVL